VPAQLHDPAREWTAQEPKIIKVVNGRGRRRPTGWIAQLALGGVLVVLLRMRGNARGLGPTRRGDHLVATSAIVCGFVPMQGVGGQPGTWSTRRTWPPARPFVGDATIAYLAIRKLEEDTGQFGAHDFGPPADTPTTNPLDLIHTWDRDHRRSLGPQIAVYPAGARLTPTAEPELIVARRHTPITLTWPTAGRSTS
jgi:protein-L-isoaspartate(D-aspartate) O-methyltransferase